MAGFSNPPNQEDDGTLATEIPDFSTPIPLLSIDEAEDWIQGGKAFIVDVREKIQILNYGRIKTSVRIPVEEITLSFTMDDKDFFWKFCTPKPAQHQPIVVYCQCGPKAPLAAEKLRRVGFTQVGILAGGFKSWVANGADVVLCPERNFHFSGFY